ncbi:tripartite tricarboxylate transporter permease [Indioceanicola profundi]|uniref:tripartite tricarboxylate transporter permease n=1 Tax=Indioceanicola profundi TaxID=2220096 RepID=UPI000E6ADB4F|nr:tripartite tricarboxylate transporter permease [Indioceanicola profundi]
METFDLLLTGMAGAFDPHNFLMLVVGLMIGVVAGALPGISFVNAMAMALPFTYLMAPVTAMTFLGAIYVGGVFGGSISSILINIPGTPASLPSCWDGYPMTRKGLSMRALGIAITASACGGIASALLLTFGSPPFARFALTFDQPEFFAATVLGLASVIAIAKDAPLLSTLSLFVGLLIGTMGIDPMYGMTRLTFGVPELESGINFTVVMIGLFAIGEVIDLICAPASKKGIVKQAPGRQIYFRDIWKIKGSILRGGGLGCMIGMIPGAGATVGAVIAYGVERQASGRGHEFGTGVEQGLAAPEAAKNATTGAALIPLLTLGIPGSAATAIMLAAMLIHGLNPGPMLFATNANLVYTIFVSMLAANLLMVVAAFGVARGFSTLMRVPPAILGAFIIVLSVVGAYGVRNNIFDVYVCLAFGVAGFFMKHLHFPSAPLVLGVILGPLAERYFLTSLASYEQDPTIFFTRPISGTIIGLSLIFVVWSLWPIIRPLFSRAPRQPRRTAADNLVGSARPR